MQISDVLRRFKIEFAAAGAVIAILAAILFARPVIGVADNGDFARIMKSTGLYWLADNPADRHFGYVNRLYKIGYINPLGVAYISTEIPLVLAAVFISKSATGSAYFDIRFLAAVYSVIFLSACYMSVKYLRKRSIAAGIAAAAAFIPVFCDTGYISYFNSLYGEPVSLVSILLMASSAVAIAFARKPAPWMPAAFGAGAFLFAGAKVQNVPSGLLAALPLLRLARMKNGAAWRRISAIAAILTVAASIACYAGVSGNIRICNKYQAVFYGILRDSPDPAADLAELGFGPEYAALAGTSYFMDKYPIDIKSPAFQNKLDEKVNYVKITLFYLRHPDRLAKKLEYAAENGFRLNQGMGNYEKYPGIAYKQVTDKFDTWGKIKMEKLPHSLAFIIIVFAAAIIVIFAEYLRLKAKAGDPRVRFLAEFYGFVALTGLTQLVLPIIGDGDADIAKHLFLFNVGFDMLFVSGTAYAAAKIAGLAGLPGKKRERRQV